MLYQEYEIAAFIVWIRISIIKIHNVQIYGKKIDAFK